MKAGSNIGSSNSAMREISTSPTCHFQPFSIAALSGIMTNANRCAALCRLPYPIKPHRLCRDMRTYTVLAYISRLCYDRKGRRAPEPDKVGVGQAQNGRMGTWGRPSQTEEAQQSRWHGSGDH